MNGIRKDLNRTKTVGTFALGTRRLYDFLHENTAVELWPVRYVNDPRQISRERGFVSINATLSVDFLGQCASETINGQYYSSSGGQNDFARGAAYSKGGQGFIVLHSTTSSGASRIVSQLAPATRCRPTRTPSTRWSPSTASPSSAAAASASAPRTSSTSPTPPTATN